MLRIFLAGAALIAGIGPALAQSPTTLPLVRTCSVAASAEPKQPRLVLVESRNGDKITTYMQVTGPTKSNGELAEVSVKVEPFDAVIKAKGNASNAGSAQYMRVMVTDGWSALLNRIRKGEKLVISAGNETISMPLVGSGTAVNAFQRCTS